jgi:hypothetical protein
VSVPSVSAANPFLVDLARAVNPAELAAVIGITELDPWQRMVLESDSKRTALCNSRQSGKSTVASLKACHRALYYPGSVIVVLSASLRQTVELFLKIQRVWSGLGRPVKAEGLTTKTMTLANSSRVICLPGGSGGDTLRGISAVDLLVVDESAYVEDSVMAAVRPVLAVSSGALLALGTPAGQRGWFYESWANGGDEWLRVSVSAYENPRVDRAFLDSERAVLGDALFGQEYLCEWLAAGADAVFRSQDIAAAFRRDVQTQQEVKWPTQT